MGETNEEDRGGAEKVPLVAQEGPNQRRRRAGSDCDPLDPMLQLGSQVGGAGPYALRRNITLTEKSPETVRSSKAKRQREGSQGVGEIVPKSPTAHLSTRGRPQATHDGVFLDLVQASSEQAKRRKTRSNSRVKQPPASKASRQPIENIGGAVPTTQQTHTSHPANPPSDSSSSHPSQHPCNPSQNGSQTTVPPPCSAPHPTLQGQQDPRAFGSLNMSLQAPPSSLPYHLPPPPPPLNYGVIPSSLTRPMTMSTSNPIAPLSAPGQHSQTVSCKGVPPQNRAVDGLTSLRGSKEHNAHTAIPLSDTSFQAPTLQSQALSLHASIHSSIHPSTGPPTTSTSSIQPVNTSLLADALFPSPSRVQTSSYKTRPYYTHYRHPSAPLELAAPSIIRAKGHDDLPARNEDRSRSVPPDLPENDGVSTALHRSFREKVESMKGSKIDALRKLSNVSTSTGSQPASIVGPLPSIPEESPRNDAQGASNDWEDYEQDWEHGFEDDPSAPTQDRMTRSQECEGDAIYDDSNSKDETSGRLPGSMGRPSGEQRKMLDAGFDAINDSFAALAGKVGFPVSRVKQMWSQKNRMLTTKPRGGNGVNYFNLYGKLFAHTDHKSTEIARALEYREVHLSPEELEEFKDTAPDRRECYIAFRQSYPEDLWKKVLEMEVQKLSLNDREGVTLQTRKMNFESSKAAARSILDEASRNHQFEALLVLTGSHHSDKNLVYVHETEGAQGFVEERLKTQVDNLAIRLQIHSSDRLERMKPLHAFSDEDASAKSVTTAVVQGRSGATPGASASLSAKGGKAANKRKRVEDDEEAEDQEEEEGSSKSISDEAFAQMGQKEWTGIIRNHLCETIRKTPGFEDEKMWKVLHWRRLPNYFSSRGLALVNWHRRAGFPEESQETGKGMRESGADSMRLLANDCRKGRGPKVIACDKTQVKQSILPVIVTRAPNISGRPDARGQRFFLDGFIDSLGPCSTDDWDYVGPPRQHQSPAKPKAPRAKPQPTKRLPGKSKVSSGPSLQPSTPDTSNPLKSSGNPDDKTTSKRNKQTAQSRRKGSKADGSSKTDEASTKTGGNRRAKSSANAVKTGKGKAAAKSTKKTPLARQVGGGGKAEGSSSGSDEEDEEMEADEEDDSGSDVDDYDGGAARNTSKNVPRRNARRKVTSKALVDSSTDESSASDSSDSEYNAGGNQGSPTSPGMNPPQARKSSCEDKGNQALSNVSLGESNTQADSSASSAQPNAVEPPSAEVSIPQKRAAEVLQADKLNEKKSRTDAGPCSAVPAPTLTPSHTVSQDSSYSPCATTAPIQHSSQHLPLADQILPSASVSQVSHQPFQHLSFGDQGTTLDDSTLRAGNGQPARAHENPAVWGQPAANADHAGHPAHPIPPQRMLGQPLHSQVIQQPPRAHGQLLPQPTHHQSQQHRPPPPPPPPPRYPPQPPMNSQPPLPPSQRPSHLSQPVQGAYQGNWGHPQSGNVAWPQTQYPAQWEASGSFQNPHANQELSPIENRPDHFHSNMSYGGHQHPTTPAQWGPVQEYSDPRYAYTPGPNSYQHAYHLEQAARGQQPPFEALEGAQRSHVPLHPPYDTHYDPNVLGPPPTGDRIAQSSRHPH